MAIFCQCHVVPNHWITGYDIDVLMCIISCSLQYSGVKLCGLLCGAANQGDALRCRI